MKKLSDYLISRHRFLADHPDQALYIVNIPKARLGEQQTTLDLARYLFTEEIKAVKLIDGIGTTSIHDRDKIASWCNQPRPTRNGVFPGFREMYEDIRNKDLKLAKFDIFYGFNFTTYSGTTDLLIEFYCDVMDAMKYRFYAVPQYFDLRLGADESISERFPDAWVFYFEDENDHLLFASLVDLDLQRQAAGENGLFRPPPKKDIMIDDTAMASVSLSGNSVYMLAGSGVTLTQLAPMKPSITGHLTTNPDGTVTITGV